MKPDFAEAFSNLGNALTEHGNLEEAIASYRQALRVNPRLCHGLQQSGERPESARQIRRAIANYEQALRLKPDYAEAYNNLGVR